MYSILTIYQRTIINNTAGYRLHNSIKIQKRESRLQRGKIQKSEPKKTANKQQETEEEEVRSAVVL